MAIFSGAAVATFLAVEASFFTTAIATGLNIAVGIGASAALSYVSKAIAGDPAQPEATTGQSGIQGSLRLGGIVPRSFNVGYSVTPGSLVYSNYHGGDSTTPNAYMTEVIALADLPSGPLTEFWVNDESVTLPEGGLIGGAQGDDAGYAIPEYVKPRGEGGPDVPHLYIKYYDGTQTTADAYLVGTVGSADRPYESTRVGIGVAYVVITYLENDTLWSGFPEFKFAGCKVKLYDPSKDTTNGGSGSHRYDDTSTWGGDGDDLPAVQIYNILRGFHYNDIWLYGLQNMVAARLPSDNWIAQIEKCRAVVEGEDGDEPAYRSGGQIDVNTQAVNAIENILTTCQGRISEIGGFYKLYLGAPDDPVFSFNDDNILSDETQVFRPFFSLSDSVNGIQATYPDPAQGWNMVTAPAYYRPDLEVLDGNRRLLANPALNFVPYPAQVQRLQKSAIEEAQRARTHTYVLPPEYWALEPGDIGEVSSVRNGYVDKLFRVDEIIDQSNLNVIVSVTEIDPSDYDWDHDTEFEQPNVSEGTAVVRPPAQPVIDWDVEPYDLRDSGSVIRKPAILITWDGELPGTIGIKFEVRLAVDNSAVTRGQSPPETFETGSLIVTQSLLPNEAYEVRIQYIPSAPREMEWTEWRLVTTNDVRISAADLDTAIVYTLTTLQDQFQDQIDDFDQRFSALLSAQAAYQFTDSQDIRSQLDARVDTAEASITALSIVAADADTALAANITNLFAGVDGTSGEINVTAAAIATLDGYAATKYSVTLDVNGYATGFTLFNGGSGVSTTTFIQDKFQIALPGVLGGDAVPVFTIGSVGGITKIGIRGDMFVDGTIYGSAIVAGTITASMIAANTITAAEIEVGAIDATSIAVNGVDILNIVPGAATAQDTKTYGGGAFGSETNIMSSTMTIKSGIGSVTMAGTLSVPSGETANVHLLVDGVTIHTQTYGAGNNPVLMVWDKTGLSVGSHSFNINVQPQVSSAGVTVGACQMRVQDLRR